MECKCKKKREQNNCDSDLNSIEDDSVNALANLAINVIVEDLDEVASRRKVILQDRWQEKQWFSDASNN